MVSRCCPSSPFREQGFFESWNFFSVVHILFATLFLVCLVLILGTLYRPPSFWSIFLISFCSRFRTPEPSTIPFDLDPVYQYPLPPLDIHLQELDGKLYFRNLCKQEFTEESLDCYLEILRFKNSPDQLRKTMAIKIWNEYFFHKEDPSDDLTTQPNRTVNVTSNLYTNLRDKIETKDITLYVLAIFPPSSYPSLRSRLPSKNHFD